MNYASFGTRFLAALIDIGILMIAGIILGFVLALVLPADTATAIGNILGFGLNIAYFVFYQQSTGQTFGKRAMKIKVVDGAGKTPSLVTFFLREVVGKLISSLILFIGYFWMLWDPKKQCLHDKIASTYVVKA